LLAAVPPRRDPVCRRTVEAATVAAATQYEGKTYCFCSDDCHQEFMLDPTEYTGEQAEA
jgi:P-type Cu+ transporter